MAEWGRNEYSKKWPSRTPVWTWGAIFLSVLFFAGMLTVEYEGSRTTERRLRSQPLTDRRMGRL